MKLHFFQILEFPCGRIISEYVRFQFRLTC